MDHTRALTGLRETMRAIADNGVGRFAIVAESRNHMVRIALPGEEPGYGWYPATVRDLPPNEPGVLIPLRGGSAIFIPSGPNLWTTNLAGRYLWTAGKWMSTLSQWGARGDPAAFTVTPNRTYGVAFDNQQRVAINTLAVYVNTAIAASSLIIGVYETNTSGYATGTPIASTAALASTSTGTKSGAITETVLKAGHRYVLSVVCSHAIALSGTIPAIGAYPTTNYEHYPLITTYGDSASFALVASSNELTYGNRAHNPVIAMRRQP